VAPAGTRFRHKPTITIVGDSADGTGGWTQMIAPVAVPDAYDNYCPHYSPALLPAADNTHVAEISTMEDGAACVTRFATGRV
jgi:hypothetical protein